MHIEFHFPEFELEEELSESLGANAYPDTISLEVLNKQLDYRAKIAGRIMQKGIDCPRCEARLVLQGLWWNRAVGVYTVRGVRCPKCGLEGGQKISDAMMRNTQGG